MAASVTTTPPPRQDRLQEPVFRYKVDWVSAVDGSATGDLGNVYNGVLYNAVFVPSTTDVPTDQYDVTITDDFGLDILATGGANRSATNKERVTPTAIQYHGNLTLNVTNAGNTKAGSIYLYVR